MTSHAYRRSVAHRRRAIWTDFAWGVFRSIAIITGFVAFGLGVYWVMR